MSGMLYGDSGEPIGRVEDVVRMLSAPPEQQDREWIDGLLTDVAAQAPPRHKRVFYRARHRIKRRLLS